MLQGWSPFDCRQAKIGPAKLDGPMTFGYEIDAVGVAYKKSKMWQKPCSSRRRRAFVIERDDFEAALQLSEGYRKGVYDGRRSG
jgi:hypothetical protein